MGHLLTDHLGYLSSVLNRDLPTRHKIDELLPLRELLTEKVLEDNSLIANFVQEHWIPLSRLLFSLKEDDVDGFQQELLSVMVKYPPNQEPSNVPNLSERYLHEALEMA